MPRNRSGRTWVRGLTWVISGVAFCSQAIASVFPLPVNRMPSPDDSRWSDLRATLAETGTAQALDAELRAFVLSAGSADRLDDMIRQSYAMASAEQIPDLDRLWVETLSTLADGNALHSYVSVRSSLSFAEAGPREYYLENWLWKTMVPPDCDG